MIYIAFSEKKSANNPRVIIQLSGKARSLKPFITLPILPYNHTANPHAAAKMFF